MSSNDQQQQIAGSNAAAVPQQHAASYTEDPRAFLTGLANQNASRECWSLLAGTTASCMKEETNPQLCALFLQAVAQQMPAEQDTTSIAAVSAAVEIAANNNAGMDVEVARVQRLHEVLEAVGHVVVRCTPRYTISQSGILAAMGNLMNNSSSTVLSQVHVEFLQTCLMAEQYRFAARALEGTWPRPTSTVSVRQVLRYFYLRGMIHMGCNDWTMASRCFWTCLSIPSEIVSLIALHAWKKLVLVQCLLLEDDDYRPVTTAPASTSSYITTRTGSASLATTTAPITFSAASASTSSSSSQTSSIMGGGPLSMPKALPSCMGRFLNLASTNPNKQNQPEELHHPGIMVQDEGGMVYGEPSASAARAPSNNNSNSNNQNSNANSYSFYGARAYMDLVQAFVQGDRAKFHQLQQTHMALFQADQNVGIIHQCEMAMLHRHVYQLSRMFSVIPLSDLASKLHLESLDDTQLLLQQLSMKKEAWSIDVEGDGTVVFARGKHTQETMKEKEDGELEDTIHELIELTKTVQKLDVSIATSPNFHAVARRAHESKIGPRGVEDL